VEPSIDSQIIRDFLEGDVQSFNRLVRRWQDRLFHFAYRYLMDEEDAKDIVQTAFIKAYKNLRKLKNPDRFSSWLFQITVNLCKDRLKSSRRSRIASVNGGEPDTPLEEMADDADPAAELHQSDLAGLVKKTLAHLPEEQRIVIIMKEYDGFKFVEIAEILNCPVNTVKARMYYGLQHMYKILTKLNIDKEIIFNEM